MSLRFFLGLAFCCTGALCARSQPTILSPEQAAKQGPPLAANIRAIRPTEMTNSGVLKVRGVKGKRTETPVHVEITALDAGWRNSYEAKPAGGAEPLKITVTHTDGKPNVYEFSEGSRTRELKGNDTMISLAGGDFWIADLGLEFLHWPKQRLVKKEMRRGQFCGVLESTNPHPAPGAYSRVLSWVDLDTNGIINAEAYDAQGKLIKEFAVRSIKKVRGQMEIKEMEIDNRHTGSRTWIEFDLGK